MHELYNLEVRIYMRNWIVWVAHVKWGSFSNLYKATMPPATDGMMVEGEKINQSMNSMIYVMIRVIHIFSYRSAVKVSTPSFTEWQEKITLGLIPSLISFFIFAGGFYLLHSITTDASMRQVRQKICKRQLRLRHAFTPGSVLPV